MNLKAIGVSFFWRFVMTAALCANLVSLSAAAQEAESTPAVNELDTDTGAADADIASDSSQDVGVENAVDSSTPTEQAKYYLILNGATVGPFTLQELNEKAANDELKRDTQVAQVGSDAWVRADTLLTFPEVMWYVDDAGKAAGPYPQSQMEEKVRTLAIHPGTNVNKMGTREWVAAGTVFSFPQGAVTPPPMSGAAQSITPEEQARLDAANVDYLHTRAKHVRAGNLMAGIGMVGGAAGVVLQVVGLSNNDDTLYYTGMGIAIPFSIMRFTGLIVSGVAAKKYTRRAQTPRFKWGFFFAGLGVTLIGAGITTAMEESSSTNEGAYYGVQAGTQVLMDLFWIGHCILARKATKAHRDIAETVTPLKPQLAVRPMVDPVLKNYGLSLSVLY